MAYVLQSLFALRRKPFLSDLVELVELAPTDEVVKTKTYCSAQCFRILTFYTPTSPGII